MYVHKLWTSLLNLMPTNFLGHHSAPGLINSARENSCLIAHPLLDIMEADDYYTKDGTVDYRKNPADKRKTGTWKACPYILGNCFIWVLPLFELGHAWDDNVGLFIVFAVRKWMQWKIGVLWNEQQSDDLLHKATQSAHCWCFKKSLELVRNMLYHATTGSISCWFISWKILDNRQLLNHLLHCMFFTFRWLFFHFNKFQRTKLFVITERCRQSIQDFQ